MKVKLCEMHARRERVLQYLHQNPATTNNISEHLDIHHRKLRNDMTFFRHAGFIQDGPQAVIAGRKYRTYICLTLPSYPEIVNASGEVYRDSIEYKSEGLPDLPDNILQLMGYNTNGTPLGGRFIDNADFHPTPTRVAPHKVHIGNAWAQLMEMAL